MDVIGAGGPLGNRQLLTSQTQSTQVDRAGQQAPGNRNAARSVQETAAAETQQAVTDPNASRTVQRATRAVSEAEIRNRDNPLPRGSLVNILV